MAVTCNKARYNTYYNYDDVPLMLNTEEVAKLLRVSESSVRRMCENGEVAAKKLGKKWFVHKDTILKGA